MAYLTFKDLTTAPLATKAAKLNESIKAYYSTDTKVFLSYRRKDREYVEGVVKLLKQIGVTVYVDYLDETLEDRNSKDVATTLRERIGACSKFITLATPDSGNSKWMPWELGLGDRIVNYTNVAVLPLTANEYHWSDQEYGKIYSRIERNGLNVASADDWNVIYPDNTKMPLRQWLR